MQGQGLTPGGSLGQYQRLTQLNIVGGTGVGWLLLWIDNQKLEEKRLLAKYAWLFPYLGWMESFFFVCFAKIPSVEFLPLSYHIVPLSLIIC